MKRFIFCLLALLIFISVSPASLSYAEETSEYIYTVLEEDFESKKFNGWYPLGGQSVLTLNSDGGHSGDYSLYASDRSASWSGPTLNTSNLLVPGQAYHFEAYVKSSIDESTILWSIVIEVPTEEGEIYANLSTTNVSGWTKLSGDFELPEDAISSNIYFEASDTNVNFSIDDIVITGKSKPSVTSISPESETFEYNFSFEEDLNNWKPRGTPVLERSSTFSHDGQYSLFTSNRTKTWMAPMVNISSMIKPNTRYEYSAYVMYNGKEYEETHVFLLEIQYNYDGKEEYIEIASKEFQKGTWSKISGELIVPPGAIDIHLFIQTANGDKENLTADDLMPFYIDDITIQNSTVKHRKEMIQLAVIISLAAVILALGTLIIVFAAKRLNETNNVLLEASIDTMTNTFNRNSYEEQISIFEKNPQQCRKLFFTVCDVNFLKHINDNYGHEKGDNAIIRCASLLIRSVGKKGQVYRTGGDEFMCITKSDLTQNINRALSEDALDYKGYPFAAAVGTACFDPKTDGAAPDIKAIITRADKEMYKHKEILKKQMKDFYNIE